jgi:hypothetical protein
MIFYLFRCCQFHWVLCQSISCGDTYNYTSYWPFNDICTFQKLHVWWNVEIIGTFLLWPFKSFVDLKFKMATTAVRSFNITENIVIITLSSNNWIKGMFQWFQHSITHVVFEKSIDQKALLEYPSLISKSKLMLKTNFNEKWNNIAVLNFF